MKTWFLTFLFLVSCSSRKSDKELQKSLDVPEEDMPTVAVQAPNKLLEKFQVETVSEVKNEETQTKPNIKAKKEVKTEKSSSIKVKDAVLVPLTKLPKDYPADLSNLNTRAEAVWKNYKSNHHTNEKTFLDIHYLGMTVGKIMITNRGKKIINGKEVWHFHARFKSAPFYSNIYELDDTVDTYVTTDQFLSIRFSLVQRESGLDVDDLQLHDRDQLKSFWFYKQKKKKNNKIKNKQKEDFIPFYSVDPFSVVFFYQGLPLNNGDVYEIPIVNKAKILVLRSEVEGREKIETELGEKRAIRLHATTKYSGQTLKSGDMYFWFSDDDKRTLLKAQAKIKIGSVTADIVDD